MTRKRELVERLVAVPLFSRCSRRELQIVAGHIETTRVPPDAVLVNENDEGDAAFVVLDGNAYVTCDGRVVRKLERGAYFGELALLDPAPRSATVGRRNGHRGRRARDPDVSHAAPRAAGNQRTAPGRTRTRAAGGDTP